MVRLYVAISLLGLALPALATTYETRMEDVRWAVEGDQFECRLSQAVTGYGEAAFVRRAGEQPTFQLRAWDTLMQPGSAPALGESLEIELTLADGRRLRAGFEVRAPSAL